MSVRTVNTHLDNFTFSPLHYEVLFLKIRCIRRTMRLMYGGGVSLGCCSIPVQPFQVSFRETLLLTKLFCDGLRRVKTANIFMIFKRF